MQVTSFLQYKKVERLVIDKLEKNQYTRSAPPPETKPKNENPEQKQIAYVSHRTGRTESSKFNLSPLYKDPVDPLYQEVAKTLLRNLYNLDPLEELIRPSEKPTTLVEIYSTCTNPIFYKLFKGTATGYLPLEDYFTLSDDKKAKPLSFRKASAPVLTAVFGPEITAAIFEAEKKKWEKDHRKLSLTKEELIALINDKFMGKFDTSAIDKFFHFTHDKSPVKNITAENGIKIKRGYLHGHGG